MPKKTPPTPKNKKAASKKVPAPSCRACSQARFQAVALFITIAALIVTAVMVRIQSFNNAETSRSLARVSALVNDLAVRQRAEIIRRASTQLANPASEICVAKGGTAVMANRPGLGQYGVCLWGTDRQCEEWALFRGACPEGGVDVSAMVTPEERFCAITGNEIMSGDKCRVGGVLCDIEEFFLGQCPPTEP